MSTTALRSFHHPEPATAAPHPIVRARKLTAGVVTAFTAVFAIAFVAAFGGFGAFVLLVTLPMPLLFLWASASVLRSDEVKS